MSRIVFLSRKYCRGEAWCNRLLAYANGFKKYGVDVKLVFLITDSSDNSQLEDFNGLDVLFLSNVGKVSEKVKKAWYYLRSLIGIGSVLKKEDVIITTDGGGLFLLFLHLFFGKHFLFSEITEHPLIFGAPKGDDGLMKRLKMSCHRLHVKLNNQLLRNNAGVFTITNSLRDYYLTQGIGSHKICVINMFVDVKRFELPETECEHYIAYCGTLSIEKDGLDVLLKSFAIFHREYPTYSLHLIGPYMNQRTEIVITETIGKLGIKEYVRLVGKVSPAEMPKHLKNARILALSRPDNLQNRNGFPTKLGEYLATGRPVVVTSIGEIPVYIHDGVNGFLAEPSSIDSFAEKLKSAAHDYEKSLLVGKRGKELAYNEFSSEIQTKKALDFINVSINK